MTEQLIAGSIQLTHPEWLWLVPIMLAATLLLRKFARFDQSSRSITDNLNHQNIFVHPLIGLLGGIRTKQKYSKAYSLIYVLMFICLILSMTEPVRIGEKRPDPPVERDIVFIVDTSVSMNLRDYIFNDQRIDRMTMLKGVLDRFIQKLSGDQLSIIVFGNTAYTLVPLTRDQPLLRRMVARIQTTMAGRFNHAGEAISLAVKQHLQRLNQNIPKRHRVLVLLTDADSSTGDIKPEIAAELALQADIPLYSIAIGAPSHDAEENRLTGLIYEPVDFSLLAAISKRTGARTYQAGNTKTLEQAISDINQHETNQRKSAPRYHRQTLYFWPLFVALGLLVSSLLLPIVRAYVNVNSNSPTDVGDASA